MQIKNNNEVVLCGKGKGNEQHTGNVRFQSLIKDKCERYREASSSEKKVVIQQIRSSFQEFRVAKGGHVVVYEESKVREKICQALRDAACVAVKKHRRRQKIFEATPRITVPATDSNGIVSESQTAATLQIPTPIQEDWSFEGLKDFDSDSLHDCTLDCKLVTFANQTHDSLHRWLDWDGYLSESPSIELSWTADNDDDDISAVTFAQVIQEPSGSEPRECDIIFCRGKRFVARQGNVFFRKVIQAIRSCTDSDSYSALERHKKQLVMQKIYDMIQGEHDARFFSYSIRDHTYQLLRKPQALAKIGQALRDCYHRTKSESRSKSSLVSSPSYKVSSNTMHFLDQLYKALATFSPRANRETRDPFASTTMGIDGASSCSQTNHQLQLGLMEEEAHSISVTPSLCSTEPSFIPEPYFFGSSSLAEHTIASWSSVLLDGIISAG